MREHPLSTTTAGQAPHLPPVSSPCDASRQMQDLAGRDAGCTYRTRRNPKVTPEGLES